MAGPEGFLIVVALSALHCLGFLLCDTAGVLGAEVCSYWRLTSRVCLAAFMVGGARLRMDEKLVKNLLLPIVPPPLPPRACVYLSGLAELLGGVLLLLPACEQLGATLIVVLLIGVFPANLYHAFSLRAQRLTRIGPPVVYARLPIQGLFIGWARWHMVGR